MKAIIQNGPGGPETLVTGEVDIPIPKEDEILVKVEYSALNRADVMQVSIRILYLIREKGLIPLLQEAHQSLDQNAQAMLLIISMNLMTTLIQTIAKLLHYFQEVVMDSNSIYTIFIFCHRFATVHKDSIMDLPKDFEFEKAAAIPEVWCTAFQILVQIAQVQKGDTVLIHAAAAGVGTSLIQLCKKYGATVIAVSSTDEKLQFCKELGADHLINYKINPDFSPSVLEFTNNKGADIILDPVSASNFLFNVNSIAMDGRWIIYGQMGGSIVDQFNLGLLMRKRVNLQFTTLRNRTYQYKGDLIKRLQSECFQDFENGSLKPIIDRVYGFSEVQEAHKYMESNESIGKILLRQDL
ncbi:nad h quinone oxidoreductase [Stylonychia lemnae]|uniref:Nad h quinone oxidoreductase n=1 Tax=Stylonychia lemnae TaxID=5949 RepID=A0A078B7K7_STYLE|nr:nad h quinone oxidoreductase [Stylonychia lemnae]|eukprot:CDW89533.1 nad h quinone oxidoreductase [Stylonychia lemnae]